MGRAEYPSCSHRKDAMALTSVLLLLVGLATALAGPVLRTKEYTRQCATYCPASSKFGYKTGNTYEYGYESDVKTHIPGATEEHSALHVRATARLEILSQCELALVLKDVSLQDSNPVDESQKTAVLRSAEFAQALEKNPLRFAFVSGQVEAVCPTEGEETWALNVKRAILSGLQNTMNDFNVDFRSSETDVSGECPVTYHMEGAGWEGVITIKKTKDVLACTNRQSADTIFQTQPYTATSKLQSLPMVKGTYECEQLITSDNILKKSTCHETHLFRPFSKESSGALTDVTTKLVFRKKDQIMSTSEGLVSESKDLLFEHVLTVDERVQARREAEAILGELCIRTTPDVRPEAPALFGKLVHQLKKLDIDNLVSLHRDIRTAPSSTYCRHADDYLHDAIPTIGTVASARLIKELILSGEVIGTEASMWLNSLAFVQDPTAPMLAELAPLLRTEPLRRQAALSISSLVNNFCRKTSCEVREVQAIVSEFENNLRGACSGQHDRVMLSLKAIGNTGNAHTEILSACVTNKKIPMEMRVAAVNAYRRISCSADRSDLATLFENSEVDSELRINAYLGLMVCPTTDTIRRVRGMLTREDSNQVGSFVWTHLTNLMETSSPLKQEVRRVLQTESLRKEFDIDKRKFSRNIEFSKYSEMVNAGASVESNIIWSANSFVPRSASVNLTVDLFGHSVNLVEVGGRVEGLNNILQDLFDKNLPADDKKEAPADINKIDKEFDAKREETKGSGFLRIFGNEIAYADLHDLDITTLKGKFNYLHWLIELAKEHDFDFSKSFHFLDTSVNIPTIAGLPLRLQVEGNAVTDIKLKGRLDLRNVALAPRSLAIVGTIAPSAAVDITATMGVDAFAAFTGVKTITKLHTSTLADGRIELRDGKIFVMDINMPTDRMEILNAEHEFFVIHRDSSRKQRMLGERVELSGCLDGSKVIGLQLCGSAAYPKGLSTREGPYVPLTTPAAVSVILHKRDTHTAFHLEAKALQEKTSHDGHMEVADIFKVSFDTPGSGVERELTIDYKLNRYHKNVELKLITPWKKVDLSGSLTNEEAMKRATATAIFDGTDTYTAMMEMGINKNRYNTKYMPKMIITIPNKPSPTISGTLLYRPGKKVDIDLSIENIVSEPVHLKGEVVEINDKKKLRIETSLDVRSPLLNAKVEAYVDRTVARGHVYSSRVFVDYTPAGGLRNSVTFNAKLRDQSAGTKLDYSGGMASQTTIWPKYNTDVKFEVSKHGKTLSSLFEGSLAGSKKKAIFFQQTGLLNLQSSTKRGTLEALFKFPYMNMDYKLTTENIYKTADLKSKTVLTNGGIQHSLVDVNLIRESLKPLKASAELKVHYPGREIEFRQNVEQLLNKEYQGDMTLQLQKDQVITLSTNYKMLPRHELRAVLISPFTPEVTFLGHINPELRNFQGKASVSYSMKEFSGEGRWTYSDAITSGTVILTHPARKIIAEAEVKKAGKTVSGNLDFKWDAEKDSSKKIAVNGEVSLTKYAPALAVKAEWYPRRFVELGLDGKYQHRAEACHTEASFSLSSSFKNMKTIVASIRHDKTPAKMILSAETSWARGKKIAADVSLTNRNGWESVELEGKITSPFSIARQAVYTLDYAKEQNTFRGNTKVQLNDKHIGLALSGSADLPNFDGSATFTTPFEDFEEVTVKAKHSDNNERCRTNGELSWAPGKQISLDFEMSHSHNGYHIINDGELTITTPFSRYRTNKLTWNHKNNDRSLESHGEFQINQQRAVVDLKAGHRVSNGKRIVKFESFLKADEADMRINLGHEYNIGNLKDMKTTAMVQWAAGRSVDLTNELSIGPNVFSENLKFISPFDGFERVTADINNSINGKTFTTTNEIKWGNNKKIALDGSVMIRGAQIESDVQFSSPFIHPIKLTLTNKKTGPFWGSAVRFEYAPNRAIELTSKIGFGATKKLFVELTSLCPYLKHTKFDSEFIGDLHKFKTVLEFYHDLIGTFDLTANIDTADIKAVKVDLDAHTPYTISKNIKVTYSHRQERNRYSTSSSIQMPDYNAAFDHEMTLVNWNRFNTETKLRYMPGKDLELKTKFFLGKNFRASANFISPFESMENIGFNIQSDRTSQFGFEINLDKTRKIVGNAGLKKTPSGMNAVSTLTTPFRGYKTMEARFNQEGPVYDSKLDFSLQLENKRIASQLVIAYDNQMVNIKNSLETPFRGYENMLFMFSHAGSLISFKQDGRFEYPGKAFTVKNSFDVGSAMLKLKSELQTPIDLLTSLVLDINHEGTLKNFKNSGLLQVNEIRYDAKSEFSVEGSSVHGRAEIKTPEEYSLTFNHNGRMKHFNNNIKIIFNGQGITGNTNFNYRGYNIEGRAQVTTPFEGYEKFSFVATHRGPADDFNCDYSLEFLGNRVTLSDEFKFKNGKITATLKMTTPFSLLKNLQMDFSHEGKATDFKNEGSLIVNTRRYSGKSDFKLEGTTLKTSAILLLPEEFSFRFEHEGPISEFSNSGSLGLGDRKFDGESMFHLTDRGIEGSMTLNTPFRKANVIKVTFKHQGPLDDFQQESAFTYGSTILTQANTFKSQGGKIEGKTELHTTFENLRTFIIDVTHIGKSLKRFRNSIKINSNNQKYAANSDFKLAGNSLIAKASVRIPEEYGFDIKHKKSENGFTTDATYDHNGRMTTAMMVLNVEGDKIESRATLKIPVDGYDFAYELVHEGDIRNFNTDGKLQTPFGNFNLEYTHSSKSNGFECKAEVGRNGKSITGNLKFKKTPTALVVDVTAVTPFQQYKRFGIHLNHNNFPRKISNSFSIETPFPEYRELAADFTYDGDLNDFRTKATITGATRQPIKVDVTHQGDLSEFTSMGNVEYDGRRYSVSKTFKYEAGNLATTGSSDIPRVGRYSYSLNHDKKPQGFSTVGTLDTPHRYFRKVGFEITHDGSINSFTTSGKVTPWTDSEAVFRINHHGHMRNFESEADFKWDGRKITGNLAFKQQNADIEGNVNVEAFFRENIWYKFKATHQVKGRKVNTEVSIETPFRQTPHPRFVLEHMGTIRNFKTSVAITSPFISVEQLNIEATHRGLWSDFSSTGNIKYGSREYDAKVSFKKQGRSIKAMGMINTPHFEKFGFTFNHENDGRAIKTTGTVEIPTGIQKFDLELAYEGSLEDFKATGKLEAPFMDAAEGEINFKLGTSEFESSGLFKYQGRRILDGEAQGKWTAGDHRAHFRVATPYTHLREAEITQVNTYKYGIWNGNVKGSYNREWNVDADYTITNKNIKKVELVVREPREMKYLVEYRPSHFNVLLDWDLNNAKSQFTVDASEKKIIVNAVLPTRTVGLTSEYDKTPSSFMQKAEFKWSDKPGSSLSYELEASRESRGQRDILDGKLAFSSPLIKFTTAGQHSVVPGRRYLTEVTLTMAKKYILRSDVKPDATGFKSQISLIHPRFPKIDLSVNGKLGQKKTLYDGDIDLLFDGESVMKFNGLIADQSEGYSTRYVTDATLTIPAFRFDTSSKTLLVSNRNLVSGSWDCTYKMANDMVKTFSLKSRLNKNQEKMKLEMEMPLMNAELEFARTMNTDSKKEVTMTGTIGDKSISAAVTVDRIAPSLDGRFSYAPGKRLIVFAGYENPRNVKIEAYRQISGRKIPDASLSAEMEGHIVKTDAFLRPLLVSDMSEMLTADPKVREMYNDVVDSISRELQAKSALVKENAIAPLMEEAELLSQEFARSLARLDRFLNTWLNRNHFYIRRVVNSLNNVIATVRNHLESTLPNVVSTIREEAMEMYADVSISYDKWRREAVTAYNAMYQKAAEKLTELRQVLYKKIGQHAQDVQGSLLDLVNSIRMSPRVQNFMNSLQAKAESWVAKASDIADRLKAYIDEVLARPQMSRVREYLKKAADRAKWLYSYADLEASFREYLHRLRERGFGSVRRTVWRAARDYLHLDETRVNKWSPESGEISAQAYIPYILHDLRTMPSINFENYIIDIKKYIPDTDWAIWDTFYSYKFSSDIRDWVPPFKSHATVSGNQHYMTFDKKFYEFAGECSYLLARDFIDGTFSVIVNYNAKRGDELEKSLTVIHGKDQVEIKPNFGIEVNGKRTELPFITEHMAVYRVGNTLRVDNDHGVKIVCDLHHDRCTVSVTGWYFGKTAGLLGTYDNEPVTDDTTSSGARASSSEAMAHSWSVGRRCRAVNRADISEPFESSSKYTKCAAFFKANESPFRPCFRQIDPEPFLKMCVHDATPCMVSSFYVSECTNLQVPIRMPRDCVSCSMPGGAVMSEGDESTLNGKDVPKEADIVLVLSHGDCNKDIIRQKTALADQLIRGMKEKGVRSVKFGLVGFGGTGSSVEIRPHSHTLAGELLNGKAALISALNNFQLISEQTEDPLVAVEFASHYPFRAGASKTLILIPCEKCGEKATTYSAVQEVLVEKDIRLHMLMHHDFELKGPTKSPKTSFLFGLDRKGVFTNKDVGSRDIQGDFDLRRQIALPKDLCVALSHETDGSIFNARKVSITQTKTQKRFLDVFSRVTAKKGIPADCQVCECRSDEIGVGHTVCHSCEPRARYVYSWEVQDLPEPELVIDPIPKGKGRVNKRPRGRN